MTQPPPPPPTLCEVTYDHDWDLSEVSAPLVSTFRGISSAKSQLSLSSARHNGLHHGPSPLTGGQFYPAGQASLGDNGSVASFATPSHASYYDYLKNYYWEHPSNAPNGMASASPSLPAYAGTALTCGGCEGPDGAQGQWRGVDRALLSLPSLSRMGQYGEEGWGGWEEKKNTPRPGKLKWVDALNAWVQDKQPYQRPPYLNFINTPPRVERYMYSKEEAGVKHGIWPMCQCPRFEDHMRVFGYKDPDRHLLHRVGRSSQKRGKDDSRLLQRKAYSSPMYDPEVLRKSRTVRFEAPRTANNSPQLIMTVPEQIDLPQADLDQDDATTLLEGESFELVQAREEYQERVVLVLVKESEPQLDHVLDPPVVLTSDPIPWPVMPEERLPSPEPELEVVEDIPEEEPPEPQQDLPDSKPAATSSPRASKVPSPQPFPATMTVPTEDPVVDSSSSESEVTPPPISPPPSARKPVEVDSEEAEAEKANLVGLMSRLSSLQRAKPKPKPKKERPLIERTVKPPRSKPVEKPPPPPPPKPVKQPKSPAPKPVKQPKPPKPPKPKPEPKEKKTVPKPTPKPPPVKEKVEKVEKPKPPVVVVMLRKEEESVDKPAPLPVSPPEEAKAPEPEEEKETPPPPPPQLVRAPVKKKEKLPPPPPRRRTPTPPPKPPTPVFERKEKEDWIYGSDDEQKKKEEKEKEEEPVTLDIPTLPPSLPDPNLVASPRSGANRGSRCHMNVPLVAFKSKPRWGQKQKDTSLLDEAERERLAEERRRRHAAMMEKHKHRKGGDREDGAYGGPNFEDYGFLAKYCILNPATTEKYRYTFDHLDEGEKGYLTEEETAYGLRAINPNLSTSERTYLFRVLEMAGHKMKLGTDFKLFSILAALSQRVSRLDEWARQMMTQMDYRNLEMKLFLCKTLWECNVDETSKTISLDQLVVELRAGGISSQHEAEVRHKLADHRFLDFFDFLMYVPLFVMIHETVVTDPLSVSRPV